MSKKLFAFSEDPAVMESHLRSLSDQDLQDYIGEWSLMFGIQMPESDKDFAQHIYDSDLAILRMLLGTLKGLVFVYAKFKGFTEDSCDEIFVRARVNYALHRSVARVMEWRRMHSRETMKEVERLEREIEKGVDLILDIIDKSFDSYREFLNKKWVT